MNLAHEINTQESPGGILSIKIHQITNVENCPDIITANNVGRIVFTNPLLSIDLYPVYNDVEIKDPWELTEGGRIYVINAGFTVKSQQTVVDEQLYAVIDEPVIMEAVFRNGNKRLYGSVVSPLYYSYQPYNGVEPEDGSGYRVTINGRTSQKPIYL